MLEANGGSVEKEGSHVCSHPEVDQTRSRSQGPGAGKRAAASGFGPDLCPVLPAPEEPPAHRGGVFENDSKELADKDEKHFAKSCCPQRPQMMSEDGNATGGQAAAGSAPGLSQALISTDDLLDCLVNPQVIRMVAQLLIQGKSL